LTKASKGQNLTPDEQKLVAGAALMKTENRLRNAYPYLKESEVQQAQVVLAAQDMVDKMQSMLEDTTEMQFKELPALVDSIAIKLVWNKPHNSTLMPLRHCKDLCKTYKVPNNNWKQHWVLSQDNLPTRHQHGCQWHAWRNACFNAW
jgi:hypothetical protein